jgi:hypothetical protein
MRALFAILTLAAPVLAAGAAAAQAPDEVRGTVVSVDVPNRVIVLDDGRRYRVSGESITVVGGTPVRINSLTPGTHVVVRSGELVAERDWRDIGSPGPSTPGTTTVQAPPAQIRVQVPPSRIVVEQQPAQIIVQQSMPEVDVRPAPPPQVTMQGEDGAALPRAAAGQAPGPGQTETFGHAQPAQPFTSGRGALPEQGTVAVQAPAPQARVQVPPSRIVVEQQPAQIIVEQARPQVEFTPAPPPRVIMQSPRTEDASGSAQRAPSEWATSETDREAPSTLAEQYPPARPSLRWWRSEEIQAPRAAPWCEGAYRPTAGTNFGACSR